jgi:hypothetical protein
LTDEETPISQLWTLRKLLGEAVEDSRWDDVTGISGQLLVVLRKAVDPSKCQVGVAHLDGIYTLGTTSYEKATPKAKRALNKMNRILRTAKMNLPKKKGK